MRRITIRQSIAAIRRLPSDPPIVVPGKWYRTQKEHWLGWLSEYHGPGAYGRARRTTPRDAQFAYNHIVEVEMLLWLIDAAGVPRPDTAAAHRAAAEASSLPAASAAVRRCVPWKKLHEALFGESFPQRVPANAPRVAGQDSVRRTAQRRRQTGRR